MRKPEPAFKPLSLAQHFEAPDDFVGCFGWICGYSADTGFLDDAVERFTRRIHAQRAYEGRVALALMLDPSNPQITPKEVPGAIHLPLSGLLPFRLLHAKLALLGFRHTSDPRQWRVRLIVSTGNWTRQTLEDSLDLAWRVDFCDRDLKSENGLVAQAGADLGAAWGMIDWLRRRFDFRVLKARVPGREDFESEATIVERWVARATKLGTGLTPRFFDNRGASLLARLPNLVLTHASQSARNYLGMGSGYYESSDSANKIPPVLKSIVETLRDAQLLVRQPEIDIFVNPKACQAVAGSVASLNKAGWTVREAGQPECFKAQRSLHAKFIFSASYRENSDFCNGAWLYLGSGNLTGPGFANAMAPQIGNLEAGVVITPESLRWHAAKGIPLESVVTNLLPLQWETDFNQEPGPLAPGSEMPDPEMLYSAPPVAYFFWIAEENANWLRTSEESLESFDLLDDAGHACIRDLTKGFPWRGPRPRQLQVRWCVGGQERRAWIPVIDEFGRIAATILPRIDIDEAWNQLADFPMPPDEAELPVDAEIQPTNDTPQGSSGDAYTANYPVRQMMQLVENIATKQTSVAKVDWVNWCTRLEQCLVQAAGSTVLEVFLKLGINPLSPLWHPSFRPAFATTRETVEGLRYESVLKRVETAWNVAGLPGLGDHA
ncbi:MAG TPA: hypothetical protein VKB79_06395 [Bryobacteraceae bacterium]|nr:hypothetical protein [Bryobacteraceae bacterium]